jgi:hypothetical protein
MTLLTKEGITTHEHDAGHDEESRVGMVKSKRVKPVDGRRRRVWSGLKDSLLQAVDKRKSGSTLPNKKADVVDREEKVEQRLARQSAPQVRKDKTRRRWRKGGASDNHSPRFPPITTGSKRQDQKNHSLKSRYYIRTSCDVVATTLKKNTTHQSISS